jgi:exopolyphosphatase / guanosine-5'-triphosphate,3'-diphosphate pyrophosphatase
MRVAVVDMGTNSTRLLVADADGPDTLVEVERILEITRLGAGVDRDRRLRDDAIERTLAVVRRYRAIADAHGAAIRLATATSAVRDAANGADFLARLERETGFPTRLLPGEEEARLTRLGVLAGRPQVVGAVAIIDVGGGSTEVSVGPGRAVSLDAGCVRATERWLAEDAVSPALQARAAGALRDLFATGVPDAWLPVDRGIAVAGTATTVAALDLGLPAYDAELIHGHVLTRGAIAAQRDRLAPLTADERRAIGAIEPGRASVIVGGILVLEAALDRLGLAEVAVSERDILHGIALLAAGYASA